MEVQTQIRAAIVTPCPTLLQASPALPEMTSKVFKGLMPFFLTLYFSLVSLLGARLGHLRTRIFQNNHIYKVIVHAEGKVQAQKRLEKTLSLHFRFIPSTEISKIIKNKNKNKSKKQQTLGKKENLISRVPIDRKSVV